MLRQLKTIRGKQLLLAVVVSAIPLLVLGHLLNMFAADFVRRDVMNGLQQITSDKAQSIRQWFAERKADVALLASTDYVKNLFVEPENQRNHAEFRHFFDEFAYQYGTYTTIFVFDENRALLEAYPRELSDDLAVPREAIATAGRADVSDAFLHGDKAHVFISTRILHGQQTVGTLVAAVRLEALNQITDNILVGKTGEAYLVNSSGYFVTHQHRRRVLTEDYSEVDIIARLISGKEHSFVGEVVDYRGIPVLGAYFYLPELGWGLVAEQDVEEAFAPVVRLSGTLLLWVLVASVVVAIFAYVLTHLVLRPLGELRSTIQHIRAGELEVRFPVRRRDEIGIIGDAFNAMLEQLQEAQEKLKQKIEASDRKLVQAHAGLQKQHEELKQAQDRLLRSERLSTMGEVAAGLAHEINNPLGTINMLVNSLGPGPAIDDIERERAVEVISEEIEKIASMIGRFQDLTHPQEMRREPVVIERVIDRTLTLLRPKLNHARIKVSVDVAKQHPAILGDERHLAQLLLNLVLNSINAMPDGGDIRISAGAHTSGEGQRHLRLRVQDSGQGIMPEIRDRIFNPFFTTRAEGTGLGLLIVQQTAEHHGGRVSVESNVGEGTTIIVDLPESEENA